MRPLEWRDTCDTVILFQSLCDPLPWTSQRSYTNVSMTAVDIEIQTNHVSPRPTRFSLLRVFS
jgi:hypothetical protein